MIKAGFVQVSMGEGKRGKGTAVGANFFPDGNGSRDLSSWESRPDDQGMLYGNHVVSEI